VIEAYPQVAGAMRDEGWEFMGHGYYQMPTHKVDDQAAMIAQAVGILSGFTGRPTAGWLGPGLTQTHDTTDLLAANGIRYCGDYILDDVPVPIATAHGPIWSMPYSAELNDIPMIAIQQHPAREIIERTTAQLDRLLMESEADGGCRVMGIGLHPYISGVPHRIGFFEQILDLVASRPGAQFAQGSQILDWWTA
jgi:allantoinase